FQGQVPRANLDQPRDGLVESSQDRGGNPQLVRAEQRSEAAEPVTELGEREARGRDDAPPLDRHGPAFWAQARASTVGTDLGDEALFEPVAIIGLAVVGADVFGVAAQEVGGEALEAALAHGRGRLGMRDMAAERWALYTEEQQVALRWRVVLQWQR